LNQAPKTVEVPVYVEKPVYLEDRDKVLYIHRSRPKRSRKGASFSWMS